MANLNVFRTVFERFASVSSRFSGSPAAFIVALSVIVGWAATGPFFSYNDAWQLVINTGTTIITFLMVFVLQNSQNRDTDLIQTKLNHILISHLHLARRVLELEELAEEELDEIRERQLELLVSIEALVKVR